MASTTWTAADCNVARTYTFAPRGLIESRNEDEGRHDGSLEGGGMEAYARYGDSYPLENCCLCGSGRESSRYATITVRGEREKEEQDVEFV